MRRIFRREGDDSPGSSRSRGGHVRALLSTHSVAGQVFLLQLALTVLLVVAALVALFLQSERAGSQGARQRSIVGAETFARAPGTLAAMRSADPTAVLQPAAEAARKASGVDFIIAFGPDGIRWTHPDPRLIGKHVLIRPPLDGRAHTATFTTSLGPAVSTTVPVRAGSGPIAGLVSVGIRVHQADEWTAHQLPLLLGSAAGALLLVTGGAAWVSQRLRRQTNGLHPAEMREMYDHHDAVLHAVREGVLIISHDGVLLLANDEARRLLELPADAERRPVAELDLSPRLRDLLASGRSASDEVHLAGDRLLAVNVRPAAPRSGPAGTVVTLRDSTELRALAGRAGVAQERLKLIYDAGLRIGTTLDVGRTAEELAAVAVPRFADVVTVELLEPVLHGDEPAAGADPGLRRMAVCGVPEESAIYRVGDAIAAVPGAPMAEVLTSGRPVLLRDLRTTYEWRRQDVAGARRVLEQGIRSLVAVPLQARGVILGVANFWRSDLSGRFEPEDMAFAEELTARAAVAIDNARRYTREHTTAVTLQRSLLPQTLPEQTALEVAHRYLPAHAGVGGDWFDVIPLPGARVALVVGDVVGHGLHAAATMGRLRTAVHNFSALDLPPDELLSHLDELVSHIDTDEARAAGTEEEGVWPGGVPADADGGPEGAGHPGITGATLLYAIYDPVGGRTTLATAGHPVPAVVAPDGAVSFPEVPVSPPLGLGGSVPVETAELTLREGSRLVLYTNGLVQHRDRTLGAGLELLRTALAAGADRTPEQTCAAVLDAMLPDHPSDDIALLVARTRLLGPGSVADWEVPSDPAAVAPVRSACLERLESWGLTAIRFTTELILSELLTNAIRYGAQPIRVRLLLDRSLICEVSDGTSASPHLRRAAATDEGGRGLFLVAQFAQRWGTRYTPGGKVIWTEQSLDGSRPATGPESADDILDQWDDVPEL
ncbi:SpoIIE family protein phosphatase/ATP-binding protein [Streptomyces kronopolitis]|uniref:SpoIIE family protein phosphatase/ATP-binding protein n=1 Tax=Streptomyces kronopolitis TaxID=1612435 RepID=UPI0020BFB182|nr:SpoIIE family protein phosphatase/ATP-binding protein [Streptomyces kronopolitis]MCL6299999.1 SpoIIE family protein phosphatase [Streptomyces kronopolitis]